MSKSQVAQQPQEPEMERLLAEQAELAAAIGAATAELVRAKSASRASGYRVLLRQSSSMDSNARRLPRGFCIGVFQPAAGLTIAECMKVLRDHRTDWRDAAGKSVMKQKAVYGDLSLTLNKIAAGALV